MSASRRESADRSVEPSNVNGINKQNEMWIHQCMKDDWEIQYPHKFQIRAIHHIAFQRDQILYLVARPAQFSGGSESGRYSPWWGSSFREPRESRERAEKELIVTKI